MESNRLGLFVYYRWLLLLLASGLCLFPLWATFIGGFNLKQEYNGKNKTNKNNRNNIS